MQDANFDNTVEAPLSRRTKRNWRVLLLILLALLLAFVPYSIWQKREAAHATALADKDQAQAKLLADKEEAHLAALKEKDAILEENVKFALDQVQQIEAQIDGLQKQVDLLNANYQTVIAALNNAVGRQADYKRQIAELSEKLDRRTSQLFAINAENDRLAAEKLESEKAVKKQEVKVQAARQHVQYCRQRVHHCRRFCRL